MDPGGSDLESSLPQADNPCLIVEDSQPDSVALEDDPDSSYRALLTRRLSNLQPPSHSPVLELISSSSSKGRCSQSDSQTEKSDAVSNSDNLQFNLSSAAEHSQVFKVCTRPDAKSERGSMESGADSTTHCMQTEEGMSQFGLLELSESQGAFDEAQNGESDDEEVEVTPANLLHKDEHKPAAQSKSELSQDGTSRRSEVSSSSPTAPQRSEARALSVQALLHSQVSESLQDEDEDEVMSSQDDLFDGERNGSKVDSTVAEPESHQSTCTPAHSLHLLHLSGQGTLVQESLSQQSVDFVAATQDNLSQTPIIVPNSPTGELHEQVCNKAAGSPMDTSGPVENKAEQEEDEAMDTDPAPKPAGSKRTSPAQTSSSFTPERSLSLPTQPEFSHDVFIPTPSLETEERSPGADMSKRKEAEEFKPDPAAPRTETHKNDVQPSVVTASFQLELESESSIFDKKTQTFQVDEVEDSQATQIEEIREVGDAGEKTNKSNEKVNEAANSQVDGQAPDQKKSECESDQESFSAPAPTSLPADGRNVNVSEKPRPSQQALNPTAPQVDGAASSSNHESTTPAEEPAPVSLVTASQSQSSVIRQNGTGEASQSHTLQTGGAKAVDEEEEEKMDDGEQVQSTSRTEGSVMGLALSQSQVCSPEPMEEQDQVDEVEAEKDGETPQTVSSGEGGAASFTVMMLEESQRLSQEEEEKKPLWRSSPVRSASQPTSSSVQQDTPLLDRKVPASQPSGSDLRPPPSRPETAPKASDGAPQEPKVDSLANRSLSDTSADLPFHFTLPGEGEVIGPADSATPPHIRQLKNTPPLHSTPIEARLFRKPVEADVSRETAMVPSDISAEESREGDELTAQRADGKLSLRTKVVTPVEEASSGSDRFSLQKPPLSDEECTVSKATTVAKAVTSPSVFSRVREVHRQLQQREEEADALRPQTQPSHTLPHSGDSAPAPEHPTHDHGNATEDGLDRGSQQPNGPLALSDPGVSSAAGSVPTATGQLEAPSTSAQTPCGTPEHQKAVDLSSHSSSSRKRAVSQPTSFDAPAPHPPSSRVESGTAGRSRSGPSHRRHVRTIQEVRTTVTRVITDVYYEDGREVERKVVEESEEPVVERSVVDGDISPSRTGSSMTSGDLADVSSLSSRALSHHSSSGTCSSGRMPDFTVPAVRGGKSGSPRRGGRPARVGWEVTGVGGSPAAPLSPRGPGRRGRPPSRSPLSRGGRLGQRVSVQVQAASSSEEDLSSLVHVAVSPRWRGRGSAPDATSPEASGGGSVVGLSSSNSNSSLVGLRVMAKWSSNSFFYSGSIVQDLGENHFRLLFDDQQECEVLGRDVLLCDPVPVGTEVTALTEQEFFNTGVVTGYRWQGAELQYSVESEGGSAVYSRASVILSMEQGARLREQYGLGPYQPSTQHNMASDISLDNLVEGKRRRRGNGTEPEMPTRSATSSPRAAGKRKLGSSTEEERTPAKRGRRGGARAGPRKAACNTSGSGADLPSDPGDLLASHGPLPENSDLFMGFVFMLTASSENDRETNRTASDGEEAVQVAPYNKLYTQRQLEAGGGMILTEFNEEQCKAAYQSLLIADQHCRTRTYLLCVCGGVPCVSQIWVRDCCQEKKLLNYRNYLLPAGLGPDNSVVEWHARCHPFKSLKVLLVSDERVDLWSMMLTMCGAADVQQHKAGTDPAGAGLDQVDVVVVVGSSGSRPAELLKSALAPSTPLVSVEWLIDSVICGERLAFDGRPKYRHDYS